MKSYSFFKGFFLNTILLLFVVVLMVGAVQAAPPQTIIFSGDTGLKLEVVSPIIIPPSTYVNVTVHIFNASDGMLLNANDFNCEGILTDQTGIKIVKQTAGTNGHFAYFILNDTMATTTGIYPYTFHCNSSTQGGFYSSYFEVTPKGYPPLNDIGIVFMYLLFVLVLGFCLWMAVDILNGLVTAETNTGDVVKALIAYFSFLSFYIFVSEYSGNDFIMSINEVALYVLGFMLLMLPLISLVLTWIRTREVS